MDGSLGEMVIPWPDHLNPLPQPHRGQSEVGGALFRRSLSLKGGTDRLTIPAKRSASALHRALSSQRENDQPLAVGLGHHQSVLFSRFWLYREGHRGALVRLYWMKTSVVSAKLGVELKQQGQTTL